MKVLQYCVKTRFQRCFEFFIFFFLKTHYKEKCGAVNKIKSVKTEAVATRCSVKKVFLKISQNSQKNTCVRVSL